MPGSTASSGGSKVAIVAAAAVLVVGLIALFLAGGSSEDFAVDLSVVEPTPESLSTPDRLSCPTAATATSPLEGSYFVADQGRVDGSAFASRAVVAWNLSVTSATNDVDTASFVVDFNDSTDENEGILCSFVVADDPANVSSEGTGQTTASWSPADVDSESFEGTLTVEGLTKGETSIVQLWTLIDPEAGQQPNLRTRVNPELGTSANPTAQSVRTSFKQPVEPTEGTLELALNDGDGELTAGGPLLATWTVSNTTADRVFDFVDLAGSFEGDIMPESVSVVSDTDGSPTVCDLADGGFVCTLGFVKPGENVVISALGRVDAVPESFFTGNSGSCDDGSEDLCTHGTLGYLGQFDRNEIKISEAADIAQAGELSVAVFSDPEVGYVNRPLTLKVVMTTSNDDVAIDTITLTGCADEILDLESGDIDGDDRLDRSEVWQFACLARLSSADGEVIVRGRDAAGGPAQLKTSFEVELIGPGVRLVRSTTEDAAIFTVDNRGDVELNELAVTSTGCDAEFVNGDTDGDGAVDPSEEWTFRCPLDAGPGRVFAVDVLGGVVTATEVLEEDL